MLTQFRAAVGGVLLAGALALGPAASAASLQIGGIGLDIASFAPRNIAGATAALDAFKANPNLKGSVTEGFEGHSAWTGGGTGTSNPATAVGRFTSLGGRGTGGSAVRGGTGLEVRGDTPMRWSRYNTSTGGSNWLDSNDTSGMKWEVAGLPKFNALSFLLSDVADVGAKFSVDVGGTLFSQVLGAGGRLADGGLYVVTILLPETVSALTVKLHNNRLNDGFGIDEVVVGHVAPVPVPPAALLLLSGLGAVAAFARRKRAAARA